MDKFSIKNPSVKKGDGWVNYLGVNIYHYSIIEGNSTGNVPATGSGFPKPEPPIKNIKAKEKTKVEDEEPAGLPFDL